MLAGHVYFQLIPLSKKIVRAFSENDQIRLSFRCSVCVRKENQIVVEFVYFWPFRCRLTNYVGQLCAYKKLTIFSISTPGNYYPFSSLTISYLFCSTRTRKAYVREISVDIYCTRIRIYREYFIIIHVYFVALGLCYYWFYHISFN